MPIVKKNANKLDEKEISISEILDKKNKETQIYRDIFQYLLPKIESSNLEPSREDRYSSTTTFTVWDLSIWLVKNNNDLIKEYEESPKTSYSNRAHSKKTMITNRIKKLEKLGLLLNTGKVQSKKNKTETDLFDITAKGLVFALTLSFDKYREDSSKYEKILKFLLNKWLSTVPVIIRVSQNYYYSYLDIILKKSFGKYNDVPKYFINLIQKNVDGSLIDFPDLRSKMNYFLYKKMIKDNSFKAFFYEIIENYYIDEKVSLNSNAIYKNEEIKDKIKSNLDDPQLIQNRLAVQNLFNFQFKLDVEKETEKEIYKYILIKDHSISRYIWLERHNLSEITNKEFEDGQFLTTLKEIKLDFRIKNLWESLRNEYISNFLVVVIISKCSRCNHLCPNVYDIIKNYFKDEKCRYCNNSDIVPYDFENENIINDGI